MVVLIPLMYQAGASTLPSYSLPIAENVKKHRAPGRSRISSKHQVTIPAAAFRGAGFAAGDLVRVEAEGQGRVVLTKVDDLVDRYSGSLATGGELRRSVEALRDEW
jgi:bifunctional DNA-binding transcriptional regulator/antitoxin component of YhaV-PrlF toxin-antitoxin module